MQKKEVVSDVEALCRHLFSGRNGRLLHAMKQPLSVKLIKKVEG